MKIKVLITYEDIVNLKDLLKRTKKHQEPHVDLWPLTAESIIKRYEVALENTLKYAKGDGVSIDSKKCGYCGCPMEFHHGTVMGAYGVDYENSTGPVYICKCGNMIEAEEPTPTNG